MNWTWLKTLAERKEREAWLSKHGNDQMCPTCKTWQANCGGWAASPYVVDDLTSHVALTCGKCGAESHWFTGAPVMILVE